MAQYPPIMKDMPVLLHGGDYNPEQWIKEKDTIWKKDMELAKKAGINTLSVGIFSWAMLEPKEDEYHFEWLDEVMDMLAENGIKAVLATPSGARPAWMAEGNFSAHGIIIAFHPLYTGKRCAKSILCLLSGIRIIRPWACGISPMNMAGNAIANCASRNSGNGSSSAMIPLIS